MAEKMTLTDVRNYHRTTAAIKARSPRTLEEMHKHGAMVDAINEHLDQTIDLVAIREVIARVASDNQKSALTLGLDGLRGQCIETAKELHKLARAIGAKP